MALIAELSPVLALLAAAIGSYCTIAFLVRRGVRATRRVLEETRLLVEAWAALRETIRSPQRVASDEQGELQPDAGE